MRRLDPRRAVWSEEQGMGSEVTDYVAGLPHPVRGRIAEIYAVAQEAVPDAVEGVSYGMPALLYRGKGLIAVMSTRSHIGVYPFGNLDEFAATAADLGLETTKGSIHLRADERLPRDLLDALLLRRRAQIDQASRAASPSRRRVADSSP
jgi:uncharacterized protein YdhG (YjbR/CyaY superfamily)